MARNYREIFGIDECVMLEDADQAITKCDLWDWIKNYAPEENQGFLFSRHPNLDRIHSAMKYEGHSGSSYAWTMRIMEQIARVGWDTYREKATQVKKRRVSKTVQHLETMNPLQLSQKFKNTPGFEGQYEAMKKFSEGKMTYAEMRAMCG